MILAVLLLITSFFKKLFTFYIEKPDGICSLTFAVSDFLGKFLHRSIFSIKDSRPA